MFTRKDYLDNKCTYEQYYDQFVTPMMPQTVLETFGVEALQNAGPHLNGIPLQHWDALGARYYAMLIPLFEAAEDFPTKAGLVCTLKNAARQALARLEE